MRRARVLVAAAALLLAATGCSSLQGTGDKGYVSGDGAIRQIDVADRGTRWRWRARTSTAGPSTSETLRGKPTVVTVWGSWCADCHKEAPYVVAAAQASSAPPPTSSASTAATRAPPRPRPSSPGTASPGLVLLPGGRGDALLPRVISPNSVPATVVLDAQGRPAAAINGGVPSARTLVDMVRQVAQGG